MTTREKNPVIVVLSLLFRLVSHTLLLMVDYMHHARPYAVRTVCLIFDPSSRQHSSSTYDEICSMSIHAYVCTVVQEREKSLVVIVSKPWCRFFVRCAS